MSSEHMKMFFNKFGEDLDMVRSGKMTMEILAQRATACYEMLSPPQEPVQVDSPSLAVETSSCHLPLSVPVAVKKSAGAAKVKKGRPVKPIELVNQVKKRGYCDGACGAVLWKNGNKQWTHRTVSQCQSDPASPDGLCVKHQTELETQGFLRCGRMNADNVEVTPGFFGTEEQFTSFTPDHSRWVRMLENALKEGLVSEVEKSKPRGAPVVFENKVNGHVDGECCNVLNQFKGGKSKFWKCDEDAVAFGFCGACQKKSIADGYSRYGQVVEGEDFKITAEIFGTVAQIGGVAASHKAYVVKLKNQLGDEEC